MMKQSSKRLKIFISIPVLLIGGTEIQTLNLVKVLVSNGYHVIVCCYYEYNEVVRSVFQAEGAKVVSLDVKRSDGMFSLIKELRKTIKLYRPDIVHLQYIAPGLIPIITAKMSGVQTVFATVHQPGTPYGLKEKLLLRLGTCFSTAFFCVSKSVERSWFGNSEILIPKNINNRREHYTIYNAVDTSIINKVANSVDRDKLKSSLGLNDRAVVGVVGRFRKEKGHTVLLDAMTEVVKEIPDTKLLVIGDGPDRNELKRKSETLGIIDHVLWIGAKKPEEIYQVYGIMDVVAVPSLFEGFGLTAAEAMAAGRPVIASAVDGLNEIVKHGKTGYLIPPKDSKAMAKHLMELLSDPLKAKTMGEAGCRRVSRHFSLKQFSEATLFAYRHFS